MSFAAKSFAPLLLAALMAVVSGPANASEVRTGLTFPSAALKGDMTFSVYLPDAYAKTPDARFPVLYLLHGYGGNDREWIELGNVDAILDKMIASGEIPPMIAVMPFSAKSWYVDSAALGGPGDYESAITTDLVSHIDKTYRAIPDRSGRVVAGLSMGGYGAFRMAFFHPTAFMATASLSGALHQTDNIPSTEQPLLLANLNNRAQVKYHGAYGKPFNMSVFVARNPFSRIPDLSRMPNPPKILIMTGDDDFLKFYEGSCQLFVALRRAGLQAELRVDDGGHDWKLWRRQIPDVVRFLAAALKAPQPALPVQDNQVVAGAQPPTAPTPQTAASAPAATPVPAAIVQATAPVPTTTVTTATAVPAAAAPASRAEATAAPSPGPQQAAAAAATSQATPAPPVIPVAATAAAPATAAKQASTQPAAKPGAAGAQPGFVQPISTKQIVRQPNQPLAQPVAAKAAGAPAVSQSGSSPRGSDRTPPSP